MPIWFGATLAAVAAQRLRELFISRLNTAVEAGTASAPRSYAVIVAAHVGLLILPPLEVIVARRRQKPWATVAWLSLLAGATGLRWWSIRSLGPSWNVRGQVAEQFRPVTTGPYRYLRHPNYLALLIEFVALPMSAGAWVSALGLSLVNGAALVARIRAEESQLERSSLYRAAFRDRSRLLPGIF